MTASTLTQVVAGIQDLVLAISNSGIRLAPDSLPATTQIFPAVLVYPSGGSIKNDSASFSTELHTFSVDLLVESGDWAKSYARGTTILNSLLRALEADETLSTTVQTYRELSYSFGGEIEIGAVKTLRWSIQIIGAKIQPSR